MRKRCVHEVSVVLAVILAISCLAASLAAKEPKLTAEELVARHLESIGSAELRAAVNSRLVEGTAILRIRLRGSGTLAGKMTLLSEGRKVRFEILFDHPDYQAERLAFDGEKHHVGWIVPGSRSPLGQIVFDYDELLNEGLLGGALSTAWSLLDTQARQPKLKYRGLKKVKGRRLHRLDYRVRKGGGDLKVSLYFEPETSHHVLSTYEVRIPAGMGATPETSPQQRDTIIRLQETFDDFRQVDGLTLPVDWSVRVTMKTAQESTDWQWNMAFERITHNQAVAANSFILQ